MGLFDQIETISLCFSNDNIDHIAGDTISLHTILDSWCGTHCCQNQHPWQPLQQDNNHAHSGLYLYCHSISDQHHCQESRTICHYTSRTTSDHVVASWHRGIRDLMKLINTLKEFIKDPDNTKFIIHIDCGSLYYHPDLDEYNFDHISTDKFSNPTSPIAQTHSTVLPSVPTSTTSQIPPINFHSLPPYM
jgi:hypothetical protein